MLGMLSRQRRGGAAGPSQLSPSESPTTGRALRLASEVAEALCRTQALAYAYLTPDLKVQGHSDNLAALLELPAGCLEGQPAPGLILELVGAEPALEAVRVGETPEFRLQQFQRQRPDGIVRYLGLRALPLVLEAERGLVVIVEDVTAASQVQQRLMQDIHENRLLHLQLAGANAELERLNHVKSHFVAMAAHDLRSPLTVVSGLVDLLLLEAWAAEPGPVRDQLALIHHHTRRLARMIDNFLDLDQIEHGQLYRRAAMCDLTALLGEVVDAFQAPARARGLQLVLEAGAALRLTGDEEQLRRVFYNLVDNALKYSPEGAMVTVSMVVQTEAVVVRVADTGRGMTPEQLTHLFAPYFRAPEARRSLTRGTGLGLYIVKSLVEAHGGQITVESAPGAGTTFAVRLPLSPPAP